MGDTVAHGAAPHGPRHPARGRRDPGGCRGERLPRLGEPRRAPLHRSGSLRHPPATRPIASFGSGPHTCLGMHLARMEMKVALDGVLDRLTEPPARPTGAPAPDRGHRLPVARHAPGGLELNRRSALGGAEALRFGGRAVDVAAIRGRALVADTAGDVVDAARELGLDRVRRRARAPGARPRVVALHPRVRPAAPPRPSVGVGTGRAEAPNASRSRSGSPRSRARSRRSLPRAHRARARAGAKAASPSRRLSRSWTELTCHCSREPSQWLDHDEGTAHRAHGPPPYVARAPSGARGRLLVPSGRGGFSLPEARSTRRKSKP